jgi:D-psicose/D-tagatose/L-ribulose 3-epimerase
MESLEDTAERLNKYGIKYIELHGNRYGADIGYRDYKVKKILSDHGIRVSGICGMFSAESELSSNSPIVRQRAVDYIRRNLEMGRELGARYFLIVPGAVGRPDPYDDMEFERSVETLSIIADEFRKAKIRGAVEPIRSAEVSFCHTFEDAKNYIKALGSPGVCHINGDLYHMLVEESHIGRAILDAGGMLTNLHLADTNRDALGGGFMDIDTVIMSLYIIGYNKDESAFITPEPLGPGSDPYPAMYGRPDPGRLENLVKKNGRIFQGKGKRGAFHINMVIL